MYNTLDFNEDYDGELNGFFSDIGNFVSKNVKSAGGFITKNASSVGKDAIHWGSQIINAPIIKQLLPIAGTLVGLPPQLTNKLQATMQNMADNGGGISLSNTIGSVMQVIAPAPEMTQEQAETYSKVQQIPLPTVIQQTQTPRTLFVATPSTAQIATIAKVLDVPVQTVKNEVKTKVDATLGKIETIAKPIDAAKKDNTLLYVVGGVGGLAILAYVLKN